MEAQPGEVPWKAEGFGAPRGVPGVETERTDPGAAPGEAAAMPRGPEPRSERLSSFSFRESGVVAMETTAHPYWPRTLSLPGYVTSTRPGWQCAGAVAAAGAGLLALGWALSGAERSAARRLAVSWFLVCAGVHGVLEGYFSVRHRELPADTGLLAEVCESREGREAAYGAGVSGGLGLSVQVRRGVGLPRGG